MPNMSTTNTPCNAWLFRGKSTDPKGKHRVVHMVNNEASATA